MISPVILNVLGFSFQSEGPGFNPQYGRQFVRVAQRKSALTSNSREAGGSIPPPDAIFQNQPRVVPSGGFPALSGPSLAGELLPEQLMS